MSEKTHIKVGGNWKEVMNIWVRVAGNWVENSVSHVKASSVWERCMNYVPPIPVATGADPADIYMYSFIASHLESYGATGYYLDVSLSDSFSSFVTGYENKDIGDYLGDEVTGLESSTTYYYRWRAYNTYGTSDNSGTISVTTLS